MVHVLGVLCNRIDPSRRTRRIAEDCCQESTEDIYIYLIVNSYIVGHCIVIID